MADMQYVNDDWCVVFKNCFFENNNGVIVGCFDFVGVQDYVIVFSLGNFGIINEFVQMFDVGQVIIFIFQLERQVEIYELVKLGDYFVYYWSEVMFDIVYMFNLLLQ